MDGAVDPRLWVLLFLGAAGCTERTVGVEPVDLAAIECDIALACGDVESERDCSPPLKPNACWSVRQDHLEACIEEQSARLDDIEGAPSGERDELCVQDSPHVCSEIWAIRRIPECDPAIGRPLREGTNLILPSVVPSDALAVDPGAPLQVHAGREWVEAARMEYASVAAFSRLATELLAVAAPTDLVTRSHEAALDEIRHADLCLVQGRRLLGVSVELGALPVVPARREITIATLAVESLVEGCIGEGAAAAWARCASRACAGEASIVLAQIAEDELRHAALAWSIVGWCLREDPTLARPLLAAVERSRARPPCMPAMERDDLEAWGILDAAASRRIAQAVIEEIVRPTLDQLLAHNPTWAHDRPPNAFATA